ncbi:thiamine monophosphate kinase [Caldisphaera lagunensis DSM 15908]|uniref:Thiamine monophosphate kinase n=1 Tax=Caldisphaera lagunensis (strain DSM 15908 / JCM 11604 / ANMR 0165 / IC-154) TaxID=1056495 RepID=L0ABW7_CALLD|nr:AIR synthase related protein [Caldisphaera lagunensis]AFZ70607.1 thiamine monophosphate kinase [Caldisphaera lagunensis DSM 15908]
MKNSKNEWCKDYDACPLEDFLINIDGYASSRSKLPWMTYEDWSFKAALASASDVIVSGGKPIALSYSVGATDENVLKSVSLGIGKASEYLKSIVLKGDSNKSINDSWIDVVFIGKMENKKYVKRSGAKKGDYLIQIGYLGYGSLAQKLLENKININEIDKNILNKTITPDFQINAYIPIYKYATSSSDNSDGWMSTLYNISESSRVKILLDSIEIDPLLNNYIHEEEALYSWEDYNFAATVSEENLDYFLEECSNLNIRCFVVGKIDEGYGVYYNNKKVNNFGWLW